MLRNRFGLDFQSFHLINALGVPRCTLRGRGVPKAARGREMHYFPLAEGAAVRCKTDEPHF